MTPAHVVLLRCPECGAALEYIGTTTPRGRLHMGNLRCATSHLWAVQDGVPHLAPASHGWGFDGFIHLIYELFAPLHDLGLRYGLPMAMLATEDEVRKKYLPQLDLDSLPGERQPGRPLRILEVGVGTGANLPYLEWALPRGTEVEIWGIDYSDQMIAGCRERLLRWEGPPVELLLADAHALPFADAAFDRVLHVGAIASYRDPARALAEMARVTRPATPVVVVDEQLDPAAGWYQQIMFQWITIFDRVAHAPVEHVPRGATDLRVTQAGPFYYCMSFRTPAKEHVTDGATA